MSRTASPSDQTQTTNLRILFSQISKYCKVSFLFKYKKSYIKYWHFLFESVALSGALHAYFLQKDIEQRVSLMEQSQDTFFF